MYEIIQDGGVDETFETAEEAASYIESIAEAMQSDANKFRRMAEAIRTEPSGKDWIFSGSYLEIGVERAACSQCDHTLPPRNDIGESTCPECHALHA